MEGPDPESPSSGEAPRLTFAGATLVELCLGLLAWVIATLTGLPLAGEWRLHQGHAFLGVLAVLPMLAVLAWVMHSSLAWATQLRNLVEGWVAPWFAQWSLFQCVLLSIIAGWGEELLFRGVTQRMLVDMAGPVAGWLGASLLFGMCHWLTGAYAVLASVIGLWLGALYLWTDNLLVPMVAHALYDAVALTWLRRTGRPPYMK